MKVNYKSNIINLPDFIIVGAQKSATTTIYKNLKNHSNIFMPNIKEVNFFAYNKNDSAIKQYLKYNMGDNFKIIINEEKYFELFNSMDFGNKIIGESSVNYLYRYNNTIEKIKRYYGEDYRKIKIIISLRNPIDRAFSSWLMSIRDGVELKSFDKIIKNSRIDNKSLNNLETLDYLGYGMYYDSVSAYMKNFDNVHVLLYDDINKNFLNEINNILTFLDLEKIDKNQMLNMRYNISGIPRSKIIHSIINNDFYLKKFFKNILPLKIVKIIKSLINKNYKKPKIEIMTKKHLIDFYEDDIKKLKLLINKDLDFWLK